MKLSISKTGARTFAALGIAALTLCAPTPREAAAKMTPAPAASKQSTFGTELRSIDRKEEAPERAAKLREHFEIQEMGAGKAQPGQAGEPLFVRYSAITGAPRVVYGNLGHLPEAAKKSDRVAGYLEANADVYGIDVADLEVARSIENGQVTDVYYNQKFRGLPVFYAEVAVHAKANGNVRAVTNTYAPVTAKSIDPSVAPGNAFDLAVLSLGIVDRSVIIDEFRTEPELGIYPTRDGGRLAWRVVVPAREPAGQFEVFVDAVGGNTLDEPRNLISAVEGTARVFAPNPVVGLSNNTLQDSGDSASAVPGAAYKNVTLPNISDSAAGKLIGRFSQVHPNMSGAAVRANANYTDLDRGNAQFNEVMVYWGIDMAATTYESLGFTQANGNAIMNYPIKVYAHNSPTWGDVDNSSYAGNSLDGPGTGLLEFGTGGVDDAEDIEIVWHEYGHATLHNQRPGIQQNISCEGVGEGFGDYLASSLSRLISGNSSYYVTIGEWDATSYSSGNPPYLRRCDENQTYPNTGSNCEVHNAGQTWAKALFQYDQAVGAQVGLKTVLQANFLFDLSPTQAEGAAAMLQADEMLTDGANESAISSAFASIGISVGTPTPAISNVRFKGGAKSKLIVDGTAFANGSAVVEINGTSVSRTKYPAGFQNGSVSTRIVGTATNLSALVPRGTQVEITVLNPTTGLRSAPFPFTR